MIQLDKLNTFLEELIGIQNVPNDPSNNGLQVEGKQEISSAIFGVDISIELIDIAINKNADFIFVHHGLSWGGGLKRLTNIAGNRIRKLMKNDISLYAVHLPLDAHSVIGHNAKLAEIINLQNKKMFAKYAGIEIGVIGNLEKPMQINNIQNIYDNKLSSKSKIYGNKNCEVRKIAIISGGAGSDGLDAAMLANVDCLITGEVGHSLFHTIKESNVSVIALGHYASETIGVKAIMSIIEENYDIDCEFIDIPTGL